MDVHGDPNLNKAQRLAEIGKIIRECEAPLAASDLDTAQANYAPTREQMNGRRLATVEQVNRAKEADKKLAAGPVEEGVMWREHGGEEIAHSLQCARPGSQTRLRLPSSLVPTTRLRLPSSLVPTGSFRSCLVEDLDLIDARYLIALSEKGGTLPCWQAVPDAAKVTRGNMWKLFGWDARGSLGILVLSYPWLDLEQYVEAF